MFSYVDNAIDVAHKYDDVPRPGSDYEKHYHDIFELYFFVKGDAFFTVEDAKYQLHPGDLVFIQPGEYHFVTFVENSSYERYVIKFPEELLPKYMFSRLQSRATFYIATDEIKELFYSLDRINNKYDIDSKSTLFKCRLIELMALICLEKGIEKNRISDVTITEIIHFISEHLEEHITLSTICNHFHFSQSYISNKFSKFMKVSVINYVRTKKIMAAYRDILAGEKATTAAEKYGFNDYSSFYRTYKKIIGKTPNDT